MDKLVSKYFSSLSISQNEKLNRLKEVYSSWNSKINLVSRKDMDNFILHHVIHSLSISMITGFKPGTRILDAGTGGGLPGIPLAIAFPEVSFTLVDSIRKKINAVHDMAQTLELENVNTIWSRIEEVNGTFDFVISRAVAPMPKLVEWAAEKLDNHSINILDNGIIALKGGRLSDELKDYPECKIYLLSDFFDEEYFSEKKIVYLPLVRI